jgi:YVTN family beta-propeller protein
MHKRTLIVLCLTLRGWQFAIFDQNKLMRIRPLIALLTGLIMMIVTSCEAQPGSKRLLLALSKADHTLAIVDPASLKVLAKLPVGSDPHEVIATPDGSMAYVTIYGGGTLHEINVLDIAGQKALPAIDTRPLLGPHGIDFADGRLWFSAEGSKAVGRIDPATGKLDWVMGTGQDRTHMVYVAPGGKRLYTTNINSGTVSILVDTMIRNREEWLHTLVPTAKGSEGFDVSPDGSMLWTASAENGTISIIDLLAKQLVTRLDAHVNGANRLKFTPDGKRVFVASLGTGELTVIDVASRKEVKRVKIGKGAAGILMDPAGNRAFIACSPDNYIAIIDLDSLECKGRLDVGGTPDGMAWAGQ